MMHSKIRRMSASNRIGDAIEIIHPEPVLWRQS